MPNWIINMLVNLAVKIGLPWLMKKFPGLPSEVWALIEGILSYIHAADDKSQALAQVKAAVKVCEGISCHLEK